MGLLICLGGAPWGGAEIDEVNRVGRALRDKVGDDEAWFAEWTRMGETVEARGRAAEKDGHAHTAAACCCAPRATTRPASASCSRSRNAASTCMRNPSRRFATPPR